MWVPVFSSQYFVILLIENYISGREITVGILGDQPMPIVEIFSESGFYDYNSKYNKGISKYECPAEISDKPWFGQKEDPVRLQMRESWKKISAQ